MSCPGTLQNRWLFWTTTHWFGGGSALHRWKLWVAAVPCCVIGGRRCLWRIPRRELSIWSGLRFIFWGWLWSADAVPAGVCSVVAGMLCFSFTFYLVPATPTALNLCFSPFSIFLVRMRNFCFWFWSARVDFRGQCAISSAERRYFFIFLAVIFSPQSGYSEQISRGQRWAPWNGSSSSISKGSPYFSMRRDFPICIEGMPS